MAMSPRLELRQTQRLALTPALRTGLSVLRMSPLDLADEIGREAVRNPFLIVDAARRVGPADTVALDLTQDLEAESHGFQEDLRQQLVQKGLPDSISLVADLLVGELREDGYLDADLADLASEIALPQDVLEQALSALQACEPAGVGARDLPECLRLQLVDRGLDADDAGLTVQCLGGFAARDWDGLVQQLGLSREDVRARADLLRSLTPRPVPERAAPCQAPLRADLKLERAADGTLSIAMDTSGRPRVWLDESLALRAEADGFAPEMLIRARQLIEAIRQRGQTLQRIGDWLLENQSAFFAQGPAHLRPVSRAKLASDVGLHPSTISRAVAGKALDIEGRLWPLSAFFSTGVPGKSGLISNRVVQHRLSELIAQEPKGKPLSDESLVTILRAEGIDIARRTVAKYRQGLRIPSSSLRRKLAFARGGADHRVIEKE